MPNDSQALEARAREIAAQFGFKAPSMAVRQAIEFALSTRHHETHDARGVQVVPVEQLREWYTAAWATWLATAIDKDGEDAGQPTPAHLREMEALLSPTPETATADVLRERIIAAMNPHGWLGEQCVTDIIAALKDTSHG